MKKSSVAILFVSMFCCVMFLGGCGKTNYEEIAKAVLTRIYTYPNEALVEFESGLTEDDYEMAANGVGAIMKEEVVELENQIYRDILGSEVEDACAERMYGYFFTEMALSNDRGCTLVPQNIILEGKNSQYQYTVTVLYSDDDTESSEETITGRIQFNDRGKIDFISTDKISYLEKQRH